MTPSSFGERPTRIARALAIGAAVAALAAGSAAQAQGNYRLGIVTFLSGGAAGPFGVPAKNAADVVIDAINAGTRAGALQHQGHRRDDDPANRDRRGRRHREAGGGVPQPGAERRTSTR